MRTIYLVAAFAAGAPLAGCSKPEPAAGAPSPTAVTIDSAKTVDSTKVDSTMEDTTAAAMPDTRRSWWRSSERAAAAPAPTKRNFQHRVDKPAVAR